MRIDRAHAAYLDGLDGFRELCEWLAARAEVAVVGRFGNDESIMLCCPRCGASLTMPTRPQHPVCAKGHAQDFTMVHPDRCDMPTPEDDTRGPVPPASGVPGVPCPRQADGTQP